MKRGYLNVLISLGIAVVLVFSFFGCGKKKDAGPEQSDTVKNGQTDPEESSQQHDGTESPDSYPSEDGTEPTEEQIDLATGQPYTEEDKEFFRNYSGGARVGLGTTFVDGFIFANKSAGSNGNSGMVLDQSDPASGDSSGDTYWEEDDPAAGTQGGSSNHYPSQGGNNQSSGGSSTRPNGNSGGNTVKPGGNTTRPTDSTGKPTDPTEGTPDPTEPPTEEPTKPRTPYEQAVKDREDAESRAESLIFAQKGSFPSYPLMADYRPDMQAEQNSRKVPLTEIYTGSQSVFEKTNVIVGKKDWYFFGDNLDDYLGTNRFSSAELEKIKNLLVAESNWLKEQGIAFYFVVIPNKATVYSEYMPDKYQRGSKQRISQIYDYLSKNSDIQLIDIRNELQAAKSSDTQLYYRLDTHWNQHGGFVGFQKISETVHTSFPSLRVLNKSDFQIDYYEAYLKDQAWYLGYYDRFYQEGPVYTYKGSSGALLDSIKPYPVAYGGVWQFGYRYPDGYSEGCLSCEYSSDQTSAPSVYLLGDSFAINLIPFMKHNFSWVSYDWYQTLALDKDKILRRQPDVVIMEIVEHNLEQLLKTNF